MKTRKIGGIRFIWIGRFVLSYCISKTERAAAAGAAQFHARYPRDDEPDMNAA